MSNSLTSIITTSIYTAVQSALVSPNFDPEETIHKIVTHALGGHEPSFELLERVSMTLGLA